jgi:hypothetical protein
LKPPERKNIQNNVPAAAFKTKSSGKRRTLAGIAKPMIASLD